MINHIFTTPLLRDHSGLTPADLAEIHDYLLSLRATLPGEERSNRGGWHSTGNLFTAEYRQFPALNAAVTRVLFAYVREVLGFQGDAGLAVKGWTVINHAGNYNVIHNHAANLFSGALYISVPEGMTGGAIVFQDPRFNLNAHETDAMKKLGVRPPWANNLLHVTPAAGEVIIFPSWLNHYVEPFAHKDPDAVRIVISFNATL